MSYTFGKFTSLIIYILVYWISANVFVNTDRFVIGKKACPIWLKIIIASIVPVAFGGIRYNVGADYWQYLAGYNTIKNLSLLNFIKTTDFINDGTTTGMVVVAQIAKLFGSSVQVFFGILTALTFVPVAYYVKKRYNYDEAFLIIFIYLFGTFSTGFNIIKQVIAISFTVLSLDFVLDRKPIKFVLTILCAFLFHPTAIVAFPLYFLLNKEGRIQYKRTVFLIVSVIFILANFSKILNAINSSRYSGYAKSDVYTANLSFYLNLAMLLVFIIFSKKLIEVSESNKLYIVIYGIGVLLNVLGFQSVIGKRIGGYFLITHIFLLAQVPKCVKQANIAKWLVVFYTVVLFVIQNYYLGQANLFPYGFMID